MGIFPDAQGQLTHKSLVESCRISNSSKLLWLALLHERMKRSNQKNRRSSGHNIINQCVRCSRGANSMIGHFIVVLLICRNEEDPFKIESNRVVKKFLI